MGLGITLKHNEIKDIAKLIRSLENSGILLKKYLLEKLVVKKEDFSIFLDH